MSKAYIFPGQGSQFPGMGKALYERSAEARELMDKANDILGFPITDIMFGESAEDLKATRVTQPAIFIHSVVLALCSGLETPAMEYVPVVVSEAESLHQQDSNVWNVTLPEDGRLKERGTITTTCLESARNASWDNSSEEKRNALFEAMTALPEFASLNPRIAEEVKKMFAASDLQSWVTGGNT